MRGEIKLDFVLNVFEDHIGEIHSVYTVTTNDITDAPIYGEGKTIDEAVSNMKDKYILYLKMKKELENKKKEVDRLTYAISEFETEFVITSQGKDSNGKV